MITITMAQIKKHKPCTDGWKKLKKSKGFKAVDYDTPFPLSDVLEINGFLDALWCLLCLPEHDNLWRKYAVWCARQVQHLMTDQRSIDALDVAWRHSDGLATDEELQDARDAAWDAERDAAWDERGAWGAAVAVAATGEAGSAARYVAWSQMKKIQSTKLRQILAAGQWVD
jgi:hypothetical protein